MFLRLLFCLALLATQALAQRPNFSITGTVTDSLTREPLEYATVMLHRAADSTQVTGIASDRHGGFQLDSLRPGDYFARVSFLGYDLKPITGIKLSRERQHVDLGNIALAPTGLVADEVNITGERLSVEYHVEKKVINVAKQNIAPTGTAADILAQAPSVSVDIEGNVKLRGSSNFTVMIDGRPSILEANDALQQIPSGTIDKIEIITNPSARFSAEGTAGIINIIPLNRSAMTSGLINARTTIDERRGLDFTFTRPVGKVGLTVGGNVGIGRDPGESRSETRTTFEGTTATVNTNGSSTGKRDNMGLRAEVDAPLSRRAGLVVGARFGTHNFGRDAALEHTEFSSVDPTALNSTTKSGFDRKMQHMHGFAAFKQRFPQEGRQWSAEVNIGHRGGEEENRTEQFDSADRLINGVIAQEDDPGGRIEVKTDYVHPFSQQRKIETGLSSQYSAAKDDNRSIEYDTTTVSYTSSGQYDTDTDFRRSLHAGYGMYADKLSSIEYQIGLRTEYLSRSIDENNSHQTFAIDRLDLFPSLHTAMSLGGAKQLTGGYTRRVEHSRPWYLEPFLTWDNAYSVRQGNPDLLPEFTDSYEFGYQTELFGQFTSAEAFYRVKHHHVEQLRTVYSENVTLTTPENVGRQFSLGTELRTDVTVRKGWSLNLSGNLYEQRLKGSAAGRSFDESSLTWDAKLNNITALAKSTRIQLDLNLNGPTVTSQGDTEPFVTANAAIRQEFWNRSLNIALQVRDIFASAKRESTSMSPGYYNYEYLKQDAPVVTLSVSYVFNNFKKQNGRNEDGGDDF